MANLPVPESSGRRRHLYLVEIILGLAFVLAALGFLRQPSTTTARRVLHVSLIYLPILLALLLVECLAGTTFAWIP